MLSTNNRGIEREVWVDIAKGIGIILTIVGHSGLPVDFRKFIHGFHMPLFFVIAGYLYNSDKWRNIGIGGLVVKRVKTYIVPYFILNFINLILFTLYNPVGTRKEMFSMILERIYWIFYSSGRANHTPNCAPLWFLPCLFLCSIYFFALMKIKNKWLRYLVCLYGFGLNATFSMMAIPTLPWHVDTALMGGGLMLVGHEFREKDAFGSSRLNGLQVLTVTIMGILAVYLNQVEYVSFNTNTYGNYIFMFIGAISLSYACMWFSSYVKPNKFIMEMGRGTIIVLGFNYFFNSAVRYLLRRFLIPTDWIIISIIGIILCYVTIVGWNKIKVYFLRRKKTNV